MNNTATNSTVNPADNSTACNSLRPPFKPVIHKMTASFMNAIPAETRQTLVVNLERIFLRLGFNRYQGENVATGLQIRLDGRNIVTGKQNDYHVVYRDPAGISRNFEALVTDRGQYYSIHYLLATGM